MGALISFCVPYMDIVEMVRLKNSVFFPLGEAHGDIVFNLVRQNKNVFYI